MPIGQPERERDREGGGGAASEQKRTDRYSHSVSFTMIKLCEK